MQGIRESFLKGMPKFKTPEEELDYLRTHISKKEQELIDTGHFEHANANALRETVSEYKDIPIGEVIHKENRMTESDQEGIVLKLAPETHDVIMEELLGLVITKGIRNALSVVDKMDSPHIDDDFHRLLIQYLKTGQVIFDLKDGTPLYKSLTSERPNFIIAIRSTPTPKANPCHIFGSTPAFFKTFGCTMPAPSISIHSLLFFELPFSGRFMSTSIPGSTNGK